VPEVDGECSEVFERHDIPGAMQDCICNQERQTDRQTLTTRQAVANFCP
jgi:hypothetical protein